MFESISDLYEGFVDDIIHNYNSVIVSGWLFSSKNESFPLLKVFDEDKKEFLDIEIERVKRKDVYDAKKEKSVEYLQAGFCFMLPKHVKHFSIFAVEEKVFTVRL